MSEEKTKFIKRLAEDKEIGVISSLGAGVTSLIGNIFPERARTLAISVRVNYHSSATSGITVELYYVHEKLGEDTEPYTSFVPTLSAGNTVQRTVLVDVPEGGSFNVKVKNNDGTYSATDIKAGYSLMRFIE